MNNKVYFLLVFNEDWADEHDVPALAIMTEKEYNKWAGIRLSINANLGNGGECFMENEQGSTGKELVKSGIVRKYKVDEAFAKTFKKARLGDLSLCNVFESIEYDIDDY